MRIIVSASVIILIMLVVSCGPAVTNTSALKAPALVKTPVLQKEYRINAGDTLDIKFFYNPDLNEEVIVRPDGKISLQLAHEIMAAGKTPAELTKILTEKYATEIERPEITVIVRSFSAQRVFIDGEVNRPGMIELVSPLTVLQSVSQAGGFKNTARLNEVIVIRRDIDNNPVIIPLNLTKAMSGTDIRQDIVLEPYDIVYVPKSPIANLNQWVDQYIRKNIPVPVGVGYSIQ